MTEPEDNDEKAATAMARPRKLELKKTVETGQIRQSFSHGRSKMVTVEVRKKRTFAPDAGGRMAEVARSAEAMGGGAIARSAAESAARGLTSREKETRARVLQDARRAEEERQHAPAMPPRVVRPAIVPEGIGPGTEVPPQPEPTAPVTAEPSGVEAETAAPATMAEGAALPTAVAVVPPPTTEAETEPKSAPEGAQAEGAERTEAAASAVAKVRSGSTAEEGEGEAKERGRRPTKAAAGRPATTRSRSEANRRTGKLTIVDPLEEGERVRSLASVRRAREKERMKQKVTRQEAPRVVREVVIPESITVQELANRMAERSADVIKALMRMGVMATINHTIDSDTAELLATEFGHNVKRVSEADVEIGLRGEEDEASHLLPRPPVVTVMGHVDHGKTSLLDALRRTDVAAHEAGGITQHIGAYQVTLASGDKITFIDTPGHEAFTQMRARGARVTDIVVLVVAADDGVKPQTIEAISHSKQAGVPIIVAVNKMDRPDANPQRVRTDLLQHGIQVEEMGGETLCVEVSAKTGANLDRLAEAILLQSEVLDLKANPARPAEGVIIETKIERGRGAVATVLVQRGTLRVGDIFVAGSEWGRVRGLTDATGTALRAAGPGMPVEILGLNGTPAAGDELVAVSSEGRAREVAEFRRRRQRDARVATTRGTFEQMLTRIQQGESRNLPVVVKADVHGSCEAIVGALEKIGGDQIRVEVLYSGVGGISESDIGLARASNAMIIGFNVRANPQAREQAKRDGVEIRYYSIIYDLMDDVKGLLSGMLAPVLRERILGYAEIRELFTISRVGKVAGCMVTEGVVRRGGRVRLLRDNVVIHEGDLSQLRRFKDDVREVKEGYDCGISLANYQDIQVSDRIECFEMEEVARQL